MLHREEEDDDMLYEDEDEDVDLYRFPCTTTSTPTPPPPLPPALFPCGGLLTPPPSGSVLKRSVPLPDEFPPPDAEHAYGGLLDSPVVRVRAHPHPHQQHSPPPTPPDEHEVMTPTLSLLGVGPTQAELLSPLSPEWMDASMPPSDDAEERGGSFLLGAGPCDFFDEEGAQSPTLATLALPDYDLDHDNYYEPRYGDDDDDNKPSGALLLVDVDVPQPRSPSPRHSIRARDLRQLLELRRADERLVRTLERGGARKRAKERAREVEALVRLNVGGDAPPLRVKKGKTIVGSMKQLVARMVFRRREGDSAAGREDGVIGRRESVRCPSKLRGVLVLEDEDDELGLGLKMGDIWTTT
ncbi:hypothetical protein BDZ89DRAFT_1162356 [Hymenopellis radicata]|nr:hypothetical protein BDZ89DRAFT_1162356 [Hymenopellis radicata]